jgi:hypothetical protein
VTRVAPAVRFRLRPEHLDLAIAAVGNPDDAIRAYRRWRAAVSLDDTDAGSYRLIPLVHHNLGAVGALSDAESARFAKMTRFTWVKSQLILSRAASATDALAAAGIPALSIKGAAVLHHSGLGAQLRPMDDADVAVPTSEALDALAVLHDAGFHSDEVRLDDRDRIAGLVAGHHGLNLRDDAGVQVDLHWHVIPQSLHPAADDAMWARSAGGVPSREDTLVHVLAHATRWSWAPSVQWIADAALLGRPSLDWDVVVGELRRHRLGVPAADALAVLTATGLAEVPQEVVARLRHAPITERIEARLPRDGSGDWRPSTRLERCADAFGDHVRRVVPPGQPAGVDAAESFLRERWAISGRSALVRHALFVATGRPWGAPAIIRRALAATPLTRSGSDLAGDPIGFGDEATFTLGGNGLGMLVAGWSFAEEHGSWTIGAEAVVSVPLRGDVPAGSVLRWRVVPLLTERVTSRRVDVVVNGRLAARWDFAGDGWAEEMCDVPVPAGLRRGQVLHVRFVVHRPVSPQSIDHDVGSRQLGISLHSLMIERSGARGDIDAAH